MHAEEISMTKCLTCGHSLVLETLITKVMEEPVEIILPSCDLVGYNVKIAAIRGHIQMATCAADVT